MRHPSIRKSISLLLIPLALASCGERDPHFVNFTYAGKTADFGESVYYDDSFFETPSTEYNPHLASASVAFAMASFASGDSTNIKKLTRYANIESLLATTGFEEFETNADYKKASGTDTIGAVFANKKVGDKTLIYVGIRGANYEAEWASNLSIADPNAEYTLETSPTYHWGFRKAADQVLSELATYIANKSITGPLKLWTSGYSRAGATANLLSGLLDQAIASGEHPLGNSVSLAKDDLFAYCFEPPMGAPSEVDEEGRLLARGEKYSNIFNHVNFNDVVPLVAMKEVNFTRFGQDRFFPDKMTYLDNSKFADRAKAMYESVPNYQERGGTFYIPSFEVKGIKGLRLVADPSYRNWTQGLFLKDFVSTLTRFALGARTQEDVPEAKKAYFQNIQSATRFIFETIYLSGNFKGSLIDIGVSLINDIVTATEIDDIVHELITPELHQFLVEDLSLILHRGLEKLGIKGFTLDKAKEKIRAMLNLAMSFADSALGILSQPQLIFSWISRNNIRSIASGHFPEYCLACVRALDSYYGENPFENVNHAGKYYTFYSYDKTAPLSIFRKDGSLVFKSVEGAILQSMVPARTTSSRIEVILPYGEEYRIETSLDSTYLGAALYDYTYREGDISAPLQAKADGSFLLSELPKV